MFSDISSRVQENLSGVRMIRAFVQERAELRRFEDLNRQYIAQNIKLVRVQGVFQPLLEFLIGLTFLVVVWIGGKQVIVYRISIGSFVMFNTLAGMLRAWRLRLGWVVNLMQRGSASLGRIDEILRERPAIAAPPNPKPLTAPRGEIEFRGVTVRYGAEFDLAALVGIDYGYWLYATVRVVGHTGRCGAEHARLADSAPARPDRRRGVFRRRKPARDRSRGTAATDWFRSAGNVSLQSAIPSVRTSPSASRMQPRIRSAGPLKWPDSPAISRAFRLDTTPSSASAASRFPADRSSASPSHAPFCATRGFLIFPDDALPSVDTLTEDRILNHLASVMKGQYSDS